MAVSLAHQPRLHAHCRHAHLALQLGFRHERGHGINDDHVERVRAGERFTNRKRLFATVGLRHEQVIEVHAELLGVTRIERVFCVNEGRQSAGLLGAGDDVEHQRRFAGRFRPENFNDAPARDAAHAEREVHRQRAGGNDINLRLRARVAQAHDAAVAVGFGNGRDGGIKVATAGGSDFGGFGGFCFYNGLVGGFRRHRLRLKMVCDD